MHWEIESGYVTQAAGVRYFGLGLTNHVTLRKRIVYEHHRRRQQLSVLGKYEQFYLDDSQAASHALMTQIRITTTCWGKFLSRRIAIGLIGQRFPAMRLDSM